MRSSTVATVGSEKAFLLYNSYNVLKIRRLYMRLLAIDEMIKIRVEEMFSLILKNYRQYKEGEKYVKYSTY